MSRTARGASGLSLEAERDLVLAAAAGDRAACERVVDMFLPAIGGMAYMYRSTSRLDRDELIQEGVVGLLRAVRRFDTAYGTPFWGYASWWVGQAMQHLVAEVTRPVVMSDRALRMLSRIKQAQRDLLQAHAQEPSTDQIAETAGLTVEQVDRLLASDQTPRSFDQPLADQDGSNTTIGTLIADPTAEGQYDEVLDGMEIDAVRVLCLQLGERERNVLYDHYGLGRPEKTLRQIGHEIGVSAERVRQIEQEALERLRSAAADVPSE